MDECAECKSNIDRGFAPPESCIKCDTGEFLARFDGDFVRAVNKLNSFVAHVQLGRVFAYDSLSSLDWDAMVIINNWHKRKEYEAQVKAYGD